MTIFSKITDKVRRTVCGLCDVWADMCREVLHDEGLLLFFIGVPLAYPILYSWIYNNEVVRDVPVIVVDDSRSSLSREFVRMCDAAPDVEVIGYAANIDVARRKVGQQEARGVYHIPRDFATRINRGEQSPIAVYTDMSLMLNYKAIFQTATAVSTAMNGKIQITVAGNHTDREDDITTAPLKVHETAIFNPTGGYGNFIIPAVLLLILQQVLIIGVGMQAGTAREKGHYAYYREKKANGVGTLSMVLGMTLCVFMIFAVMGAYLALISPRMFNFVSLAQPMDLLALMVPFILACTFFAITVSTAVHYRENVLLIVVFSSVPMLFLSGISWPQSNVPWFWQSISWLIPSTFGIRSYVRMNTMGATAADCMMEIRALWLQAAFYFITAYIVIKSRTNLLNEEGRGKSEEGRI